MKLTVFMAHPDENSFNLDYMVLPLNLRKHFTSQAQCGTPKCEDLCCEEMVGRAGSLTWAQGHLYNLCEYGNGSFGGSR